MSKPREVDCKSLKIPSFWETVFKVFNHTLLSKSIQMLSQVSKTTMKEMTPILMTYSVYGEKAEGKAPIILLHGLFGRKSLWAQVGPKIAQMTGSRVVAVDLRNHGDSPWTDDFSHRHNVSDIQHLLQHLSEPSAHVLGHGFSGRSLIQMTLEKPALLKSVMISEASPFGIPYGYWSLSRILKVLKDSPIKPGTTLEDAKKQMDEKLSFNVPNVKIRKMFLANLVNKKDGNVSWHFNVNSIYENLLNCCILPSLQPDSVSNLPVMFLSGEASDCLPKFHLRPAMQLYPNSIIVFAGGAGYKIFSDRPAFFSEIVAEFINKYQSK